MRLKVYFKKIENYSTTDVQITLQYQLFYYLSKF